MFREKHALAWTYHRNTSRWPFNMREIPESRGPEPPFKEYLDAPVFPLPEALRLAAGLHDAIDGRVSCRRFRQEPLKLLELATLLKVAYGVQGRRFLGDAEFMERPVPSGGGLYPLELYVLIRRVESLEPGVYHYSALHHVLEQIRCMQLPGPFTSNLFMGQSYLANAPAIVLLAAVIERSLWKYGDRGYRYILLEAGHTAQNLNLAAAATGLGSLNLGGFFDHDMGRVLGLDLEQEIPLYGVALGIPATDDRSDVRQALAWS